MKLPGKNCGKCSNPTCVTFARKLVSKEQKAGQCVYLKRIREVEKILEEGVVIRANESVVPMKGGIAFVYPCATDRGKVMAETNLGYASLDFFTAELLLNSYFKEIKSAPNIEAVKVKLGEKEVIVFSSGKINVRKAENKEDAEKTIKEFARILWAAQICPRCRNPLIECAVSSCGKCIKDICPLFISGPPLLKKKMVKKLKFRKYLELQGLEKEFAVFLKKDFRQSGKRIKEALDFALKKDLVAGVVMCGIANTMKRIVEAGGEYDFLKEVPEKRTGNKKIDFNLDALSRYSEVLVPVWKR